MGFQFMHMYEEFNCFEDIGFGLKSEPKPIYYFVCVFNLILYPFYTIQNTLFFQTNPNKQRIAIKYTQ